MISKSPLKKLCKALCLASLLNMVPFCRKLLHLPLGHSREKEMENGDRKVFYTSTYNLRHWCFYFFETNIEIANIYMYAFARRVNLLRLYYIVWYYGPQRIWQRVQTLPDYRHAPFLRFLCFIVLFALRLFGENWFHLRDDFEMIAWPLLRN